MMKISTSARPVLCCDSVDGRSSGHGSVKVNVAAKQ